MDIWSRQLYKSLVLRGGIGMGDINFEVVGMQIVTEALF